jgi:hypothetical protein
MLFDSAKHHCRTSPIRRFGFNDVRADTLARISHHQAGMVLKSGTEYYTNDQLAELVREGDFVEVKTT